MTTATVIRGPLLNLAIIARAAAPLARHIETFACRRCEDCENGEIVIYDDGWNGGQMMIIYGASFGNEYVVRILVTRSEVDEFMSSESIRKLPDETVEEWKRSAPAAKLLLKLSVNLPAETA